MIYILHSQGRIKTNKSRDLLSQIAINNSKLANFITVTARVTDGVTDIVKEWWVVEAIPMKFLPVESNFSFLNRNTV